MHFLRRPISLRQRLILTIGAILLVFELISVFWLWHESTEQIQLFEQALRDNRNNDRHIMREIREAVASLIDRAAIAHDIYDDQVNPAWSIVPPGFAGQIPSFQTKWGDGPNADQAKQLLADANIATPVSITLGYTPTRYGPNAVDEANMLASQLTSSGLFDVKIESAEWTEYQTLYKEGAYDFFQLGWYPDFLDADNYLAPFVVDGGFFQNGYSNPKVNDLVVQEQGETDPAAREKILGELQDIVANDVPLVPSWNGKNVAVALPGMKGVADTLDATYIFRMWSISK